MLTTDQLQSIEYLVKEVGQFQVKSQAKVSAIDVDEKSLNQLVSYVDIESEEMLISGLSKITPTAGYLAEENTTDNKNKQLYWIIDPLDGTTNYLFGHSKYAISIALYADAKPVYACVYVPTENENFVATPDGAFLNNIPLHVANRDNLQQTLIATGFPYYNFEELDAYMEVLTELMKSTQGLRRMGSAAIDLVYTACGRFDAFFELNLSPWDVAAGAYIIQQAGGVVTDFEGGEEYVFGKSILGSSQVTYPKIKAIIASKDL